MIVGMNENGMFKIENEDGTFTFTTKPSKDAFEAYLNNQIQELPVEPV